MFGALNRNILTEEKELRNELYLTSHAEEAVLRQKSRVQWLKLGD